MAESEVAVARDIVELAMRAGATQAEATYTVADRFSTEARGTEVAKLEQSVARGVTLRVFARGAKATLATSDFTSESLRAFVAETVAAARTVTADTHGGLPEPDAFATDSPDLPTYADDVRARPPEAKVDDALALERVVRATDARISNSSGSRIADTTSTLAIANSLGFAGTYRASQVFASSGPIAEDGEHKRQGSYGAAARSYARLEAIDAIARKAARRALDAIGSRKPATMRCPVIFERDVRIARALGYLYGRECGERRGRQLVSRRARRRDARQFARDDRRRRPPSERSRERTVRFGGASRRAARCSSNAARCVRFSTTPTTRDGSAAASTGNASGGGIGPTNTYLEPGTRNARGTDRGDTARRLRGRIRSGFPRSRSRARTSRGARGFAIENGELAYPIDEFTIAGNLLEMLAALDAVANDLVFDQSVVAPAFRIAEMTVSGT